MMMAAKEMSKMLNNIYKKLPLLIFAVVVTHVITSAYLSVIRVDVDFLVIFICSLLAIVLAEIMMYNKITLLITGSIIVLHIFFSLVEIAFFSEIANSINEIGNTLYLRIFWSKGYFESEMSAVIFLSILIGLSIYILYVKFRNPIISFLAFLLYILCLEVFFKNYDGELYVNALITMAAVLVLFIYNRYESIKLQKSVKYWIKYTTPLICVILSFAFLFTSIVSLEKNRDFMRWLDGKLYRSVIKHFNFTQAEFYNDDDEIGDDAKITNKKVFDVTVTSPEEDDHRKESSLYLRGISCDSFANRVWSNKINDNNSKRYVLESINMYDYFLFDGNTKTIEMNFDIYKDQTYFIENQNIADNVLLTGLMLYNMRTNPYDEIYYERSTYVYSPNNYIRSYTGQIKQLIRNEDFNQLMAQNQDLSYKGMKNELPIDLKNDLEDYYLGIPSEIPQSVYNLAKELTQNIIGDYEKAAKIESYLKSEGGFRYDLKPGPIPKDKDLVSYFLFENKVGYCTYYATSMVMLCRSIGIPARYVKGFRVDNIQYAKKMSVNSENAHAWVEVFLPEFGWITFDPVSASDFGNNFMPQRTDTSTSRPISTQNPTSVPATNSAIVSPPNTTTQAAADVTGQVSAGTTQVTQQDQDDNTLIVIIITASAVILILSSLFAVYFIKRRAQNNRNTKKSPARLFCDFVKIKENDGFKWDEGETVAGYFKKLSDGKYEVLAEWFEKCFYGGHILIEQEYEAIVVLLKEEKESKK